MGSNVNYTDTAITKLSYTEANTPELSTSLIPTDWQNKLLQCPLEEKQRDGNTYFLRYIVADDRVYVVVIGSKADTVQGLSTLHAAALITDYNQLESENIQIQAAEKQINNKTAYIETQTIKLLNKKNTPSEDSILTAVKSGAALGTEVPAGATANPLKDKQFLENTAYFSGTDVSVFIGDIWIDEVSYIQITPQQQVVPIYSIFQQTPVIFASGSFLVRGIIGINFTFANYLENLIYLNGKNGNANVYKASNEGISGGALYVTSLRVKFNNGSSLTTPIITLEDVYISGGAITASVDGNPVQNVYQFMAGKMKKNDVIITER